MLLEKERTDVVRYSRLLQSRGLVKGTGGNISIINRKAGLLAITPSAVEYQDMTPEDVAVLTLEGEWIEGRYAPSSERDMHLECYRARKDIQATVHTHSTYATILACLDATLPPVHYLIGFAGGPVACAPYCLFGTKQLAEQSVRCMGTQNAVLLGNHGLLAVGDSIDYAFNTAEETEFVSEIYYKARLAGEIRTLTKPELDEVMERFKSYGKKTG